MATKESLENFNPFFLSLFANFKQLIEEQPSQLILATPYGEEIIVEGGLEDFDLIDEDDFSEHYSDLTRINEPSEGLFSFFPFLSL